MLILGEKGVNRDGGDGFVPFGRFRVVECPPPLKTVCPELALGEVGWNCETGRML
jgi:hypothetical protein